MPTQLSAEHHEVATSPAPRCRGCDSILEHTFVDLGSSPLANAYPSATQLEAPEPYYPLRVYVCERCFLVQLPPVTTPEEIFGEYPYFSSFSASWVEHARRFVEDVTERFHLGSRSSVVELASNDGYLLRHFVARGVPVLGVEPARNVAAAAEEAGVPTLVEFFGNGTAERLRTDGKQADLVIANNVLAHVPEVRDFVEGVRTMLRPGGVATMEFPHVLQLIEQVEFDTIYHEHLSYFSLLAVRRLFEGCGLTLFDVEELRTHGGSLRIYARREDDDAIPIEPRLDELQAREAKARLDSLETYVGFDERVRAVKRDLLDFLIGVKRSGESVVGYGAPAKATTLLNYCGVRGDFLDYVVDRSPHKQGRFLPGVHLEIRDPSEVERTRPDYLLILPWNLKDEIVEQMSAVRAFGCRFVVPIPEPTVL